MVQEKEKDLIQMLQAYLTTALFAVVVCHFTLLLLEQPMPPLVSLLLTMLGFVALLIIALRFWKITFSLLGIAMLMVGFQYVLKSSLSIPFFGLAWWQSLWNALADAFRWAITINSQKGARPDIFLPAFYALVAFLSVLSNWTLPIPILNMIFLIAPLFYIPKLTQDPFWLLWLMAGLFCVYASYAFRQDPDRRDQRPPLLFGSIVLALTFALQFVIPPDFFFNSTLSEQLNRMMPTQTGTEITSFSLAELGFYPQGNLRVGGPVKLTDTPYLTVRAEAPSFYLRGASYDHFDGKSWSLSASQQLLPLSFSEHYYDEFDTEPSKVFWFRNAAARDTAIQSGLYRPTLYFLQTAKPTRIVFHGGKPATIVHLNAKAPAGAKTQDLLTQYNAKTAFFYSASGMVVSATAYDDYGLLNLDFVPLVANYWRPQVQQLFSPSHGRGERKYANLVRKKDPKLAALLYDGNTDDFPALLQKLRAHFEKTYQYDLNVPKIPDKQGFLDNFLTNKKGYCIYFATAYSVLLRDIGYNTRYAEGFVVPQASAAQAVSVRTISSKQAHAWTEVYLDSMGWVPIEATPSSHLSALSGLNPDMAKKPLPDFVPPTDLDVTESAEASSDISEEASSDASESISSSSSSEKEESAASEENPENSQGTDENEAVESPRSPLDLQIGVIGCLILLLLAIGLLVAYIANRRYRAWKNRLYGDLSAWNSENDEKFRILWQHLHRLVKLHGQVLQPDDTLTDFVKAVKLLLERTDPTLAQTANIEVTKALQAVRYGGEIPDEALLKVLLGWYRGLSKSYRTKTSVLRWFYQDVWTVKGQPWQ